MGASDARSRRAATCSTSFPAQQLFILGMNHLCLRSATLLMVNDSVVSDMRADSFHVDIPIRLLHGLFVSRHGQ